MRIERSLKETKAGLRVKEAKTKHGKRTISLPHNTVAVLREYRRKLPKQRMVAERPLVRPAHDRATRMARGELGYPAPREKLLGDLTGAPVGEKLLRWWPNEEAYHLTAAALFIVAENEELMRNKDNGQRVRARERTEAVRDHSRHSPLRDLR